MKVLYNEKLKKYGRIVDGKIVPRDLPYMFSQTATDVGLQKWAYVNGVSIHDWALIEVDIIHKK